jgi:hypothetical protein
VQRWPGRKRQPSCRKHTKRGRVDMPFVRVLWICRVRPVLCMAQPVLAGFGQRSTRLQHHVLCRTTSSSASLQTLMSSSSETMAVLFILLAGRCWKRKPTSSA